MQAGIRTTLTRNSFQFIHSIIATQPTRNNRLLSTDNSVSAATRCTSLTSLLTYIYPILVFLGALAWTHTFGKARVFCFQLGHDNNSWAEPNFRTVLDRGIQWAAGRLG